MTDGKMQPVSILLGDRLCARCGFNLCGEPVVREPRYDLLIARCPQCKQAAAVQEYPPLGPWVARWTMLAAALWFLFLAAAAGGGLVFVGVVSIAVSAEMTDQFGRRMDDVYEQWLSDRHDVQRPNWDARREHFAEFWREQGREAMTDRGTLARAVEWNELPMVLAPTSASLCLGIFWSIALLFRRRRTLLLLAWILIMILLVIFGAIWIVARSRELTSIDVAVMTNVTLPLMALILGACFLLFLAGVALGRPIIRGLVRALLPPRLRGALAILWTADEREPPGSRPRSDVP